MKIFSQIEPTIGLNKVEPNLDSVGQTNLLLKIINCLSTPCYYPKITLQLLNTTTLYALALPIVFGILFFAIGLSLNVYPFIVLFVTGAYSKYLLQKQWPLIASIFLLLGFLITNTMLVWPNVQVLNTSYLFLMIPFISAIFLYPKKQLHFFFVTSSLGLFLFTDAISLFSSLLFSNSVNDVLLFKAIMAIALCTFVFFISNYVANYLQESLIDKEQLTSEVALCKSEFKNFSGIAAHDLREPLQTLTAYSSLLKKSLDKKDSLTAVEKDFFMFMDDSTKRMLGLLDDLSIFSMSAVVSEAKVSIDLYLVLQAVKKNLTFTIANTSAIIKINDLPIVSANFNPMLHLFQNIMQNSIKYQPINKAEHIPIITITAAVDNNYHIIYITDNGIGIAEKNIPCIFDPLKRLHSNTEYKGTGLGLSICKSIVIKYNGKIEVSSTVGKGTTFSVYLPIK